MKRFKIYYEVKRDLEVGEEIVEAAPFDLVCQAGCPTPEYFEIKKTNISEVK